MATPHGDTRGKLIAGFTDFAVNEILQDPEDMFGSSHAAGFDVCSTSDSLHNCLDPSILSIFENSSAGEEEIQIDEESEVTLLCALSDMLDNVIEETLSPFDTLPNSELFMNQRSQDTQLRRIHTLAVSTSEKEAAPRTTRSTRSSLSNGKVEASRSDRQLRPRLHRRTHAATTQRSDGEDEDLGETRRRPGRIFRIEPDPALCQDDHQDRFVRVSLADLVRHMHPYSIRVALDKESHRDVQEEEEDVYVDVEGDDETRETLVTTGSRCDLDSQAVPTSESNLKCDMDQSKVEVRNVFRDPNKNSHAAQKSQACGRVRKNVTFAANLTSIYEYQPEDDHEGDMDGQNVEGLATESNPLASSQLIDAATTSKPRALSLQEYRLLRQKTLPKERRIDHRTKWPSVPETPTELPPIHFISGHKPAQVNLQTLYANSKLAAPDPKRKARRNLYLPVKMPPMRRKPVQHVDPPNPVTVPLKPLAPIDTKILPPSSKEHDIQQEVQGGHAAEQPSNVQQQPESPVKVVKADISAPSSPVKSMPLQTSQRSHCAEDQKQSGAEIGIEATDVTSLLEQFETQGLTPPATPPHQIWKPLTPTLKAKQKQSPIKTIQIIEPQPLPPSKLHSKPQLHTSVPAPSAALAFMDHDYCGTQDFSNKNALSPVHMHDKSLKDPCDHKSHKPLDNRTSCEERLSLTVLLSPESSPCRLEGSTVGDADESEDHGVRGRTRSRCYRRKYRHSGSSSVSPSSSPSRSSSDSSSSPPRKRHRSRYSDSSSRSSSRSSSCSASPSPIRERRRRYRHSRSPSFSRSRSRSPLDWNQSWSSWRRRRERYRQSRLEEANWKQKAIEERRVVYVGRIRGTMTKEELRERFKLFGRIEDCTVHFRSHGDNYGFVTYYNTDDAFAAIETGTKLRQPDELPFDICFGGRRQFCQSNYMDLDSSRDTDPHPVRSRDNEVDFDTLLKQAQRGQKM